MWCHYLLGVGQLWMLQSFVWIKSSGHLSGVVRESLVRVLDIDPTSQSLVHLDHSPQSEYLQSKTESIKTLKKIAKGFTNFSEQRQTCCYTLWNRNFIKKFICTTKIQHYIVDNYFEVFFYENLLNVC